MILEQAVSAITTGTVEKPSPVSLLETLLKQEKTVKKAKIRYGFDQLVGTWRLCFITGTQKTRQRTGKVMGAGRYLPRWIEIYLSYTHTPETDRIQDDAFIAGRIGNNVKLGALHLSLTGPAKFLARNNLLAFDFTQLKVQLLGVTLYQGYVRGGQSSESAFYTERVSKQPFFAYFLVNETAIAARGRGGGLALWGRVKGNSKQG